MDFVDRKGLAEILQKGLTVQEAIDIAFQEVDGINDSIESVYIAPPEPAALTDEDSGDEDEGGDVDHLSKRQLLADAEIRIAGENTLEGDNLIEQESSKDVISSSNNNNITPACMYYPKAADPRDWISGDFTYNEKQFSEAGYLLFESKSIIDLFELFIDEEIILYLVMETNKYALFKNQPDPRVSIEEMKFFIAILILSGYNNLPSKRMYWEQHFDTRNELVYNSMRRNSIEQILKFLHLAPNENIDQGDKLWKIKPFVNKIKERCRKYFVPERDLAFDESMVKYYGKHSCKQFLRAKPIRFGYKVWCLNTVRGYLIDFEIYQGKSVTSDIGIERNFGKAAAPLVKMIEELPDNLKYLPFSFYFDNLFTTFSLLSYLRLKGYGGTGTLRENRIPKSCPLSGKKVIQKKERGYFENTISKTDGILVAKWVDNSVVCVATNKYGVSLVTNVKRYSQKEKKHIQVSRLALLAEYNKKMGGTDRMDQHFGQYRIQIRNRKWYWPLFTWLLDVSINNAWCLYRKSRNSQISQINFRRTIVQVYLKKYMSPPKGTGKAPSPFSNAQGVTDAIRFDRMDHLVEKIPNDKRRRCARRFCHSSTRTQCRKCNIGLCIDCFATYHTKNL